MRVNAILHVLPDGFSLFLVVNRHRTTPRMQHVCRLTFNTNKERKEKVEITSRFSMAARMHRVATL